MDDDETPEEANSAAAEETQPKPPPEGPWPIDLRDAQGKVHTLQVRLAVPPSFSIRHEMMAAAADHPVRAAAAALAACWQGNGRPKVSYASCKYDPLRFGGAVIDELVGRGATMVQVMTAGMAALQLLAPTVVTDREVKEREGFTSGGGAASS